MYRYSILCMYDISLYHDISLDIDLRKYTQDVTVHYTIIAKIATKGVVCLSCVPCCIVLLVVQYAISCIVIHYVQ